MNNPAVRQLCSGNFLDILFDCPYEMPGIVLDALNVGMLMMGRRTDVDVDAAILEFVTKYGLLGLMTALPTTPSFMDYEAVYLPKNHFIKAETMETEDYLALFYPFEQLDVVKKGVESDWTVSGDRTMIALTMTFADKLYIANCGCLPENWTLENLMNKHASSPYNPNIAHVFYLAGFIESWGRGIEKICSACEKDGVPQPEYTINPGDIMIKFTAPEDRVIRSVTGRVTEKVTDKVTDTLDETSLKILNLLAVDPAYTTTFLAENLSLSRKTVSLRLKMLKETGLIERIGSDRKGYWKLLK